MNALGRAKSLAAASALASSLLAQTVPQKSIQVTTVTGESWLNHLHRSFDETSMGKTGRLGPPKPVESEDSEIRSLPHDPVLLHGSDLYRLNCRGCHGESGTGAPPEINSVINPVRAGSVTLILERMKSAGMSMSRAEAAKLARQSQDSLLQRLHSGGQDMPPFSHLSQAEVRALVAYLNQLADVPGAQSAQFAVRVSHLRVGELIVKSTCHTCHSASGPNPDAQQLAEGAIPPLSTLLSRLDREAFIRKVTRGLPVTMGDPPEIFRGRMPVFYYLSQHEAADVYDYLSLYTPAADTTVAAGNAAGASLDVNSDPPRQTPGPSNHEAAKGSMREQQPRASLMAWIMGSWTALLILGGVVFTFFEFRRAVAKSAKHRMAANRTPTERMPANGGKPGGKTVAA